MNITIIINFDNGLIEEPVLLPEAFSIQTFLKGREIKWTTIMTGSQEGIYKEHTYYVFTYPVTQQDIDVVAKKFPSVRYGGQLSITHNSKANDG